MTALSDLLSTVKASDLVASIKTTATTLGLLPSSWQSGDPEDAIVNSVSQTIATYWNTYVYYAINGGFLSTATGKWLTLLAKGVFNVDRNLATFASGGWTGTNATAAPLGPYAPNTLTFVCLDTGATYTNQSSATFAVGVNAPITIVANVSGTAAGNAAPTRIVLQTTVVGLTGSNALAISGTDDETDAALALRCTYKWASLSPNGPADAYRYVALTPSFHGVSVNRVLVSPSSLNGSVLVTLANASSGGILTGGDVALVDAAIKANVVPVTVTETTQSATALSVPVTYQLWAHTTSGIVPATAQAAVNAALVTAFQNFPIGGDLISGSGKVYVSDLVGIIKSVVPQAFQIVVTAPAADVALGTYQVATLGAVTPTITVVA